MLDLVADSVLPEPSAATVCSPVTAQEREAVLINSSISDLDQMIADLQSEDGTDFSPILEIIVLDSQLDGIAQITSVLPDYRDVNAVRVISHGRCSGHNHRC